MKKFKLAPIAVALASVFAILPSALADNSDLPRQGDLDIYSSGSNEDKSPTMMLVIEASTFTNAADSTKGNWWDVEIIGIPKRSNTTPSYKRPFYYNSITGTQFPTRLTRMKDAIFYLMDTPGLLPDDYRIGLTRYSGGVTVLDNPAAAGDSTTASVVVAAEELGPVPLNKGKYIEYYVEDVNEADNIAKDANGDPIIEYARYKIVDGKIAKDEYGHSVIEYVRQEPPEQYKVISHRWKLKNYIAQMCDGDILCTGEAPMAAAYAEAGAYMMGTKTSPLTKTPTDSAVEPQQRALRWAVFDSSGNVINNPTSLQRKLHATWQYCPPENRNLVLYNLTDKGHQARFECNEGDWVTISRDTIADEDWADGPGLKGWQEADNEELAALNSDQRKYNLLWYYLGGSNSRPHGTFSSADNKRLSPKTLAVQEYSFVEDTFHNVNPDQGDRDDEENPFEGVGAGTVDPKWKYLIDENLSSDSRLVPILRYRALRTKHVGFRNYELNSNGNLVQTPVRIWQYCAIDDDRKSVNLNNYIYGSYRLECKEEEWQNFNEDYVNSTIVGLKKYDEDKVSAELAAAVAAGTAPEGLAWNKKYWTGIRGGRPCGIADGWAINSDNCTDSNTYQLDPITFPIDGWTYYYDQSFKREDYPALPPTLNNNYSRSGIRNSPAEVRGYKGYSYEKPSYSECSGEVQYNSSGESWQSKPQTVENAIMFITAGWPRAGIVPPPTNEMGMSLTPFDQNEINATGGEFTCPEFTREEGEGEDKKIVINEGVLDNRYEITQNPMNNHWNCIGAYSKRLRDPLKNPGEIGIKTGVFLFADNTTANDMQVTGIEDGVKLYDCLDAPTTSTKNACLLGQYGAGYGEGGFFISTSYDPESAHKELADAIVKMADNLNTDLGMVPVSMPAVPRDDFNKDALLDSGYLPLIAPNTTEEDTVGKTAQWQGNLRKYKQVNGEYLDNNTTQISPFSSSVNALLASTSKDYWAASEYKSSEQAGGVYENIPMPTSATTDTPRSVYISRTDSGELTKLSPTMDSMNNVVIDDIGDDVNSTDTELQAQAKAERNTLRRLLLNYMGYTIPDIKSDTTNTEIINSFSSGSNKAMGGVFHSTPIALTSKLTLDSTTKAFEPTNRYILFGAMDNALHIVDNESGEEVMSYFPREVLSTNGQYKAITPELLAYESKNEASPSFGVDGPWESYSSYGYEENNGVIDYTVMVAKELYAYGGARLGAKAYYGLDLTNIHKNDFKPKQFFTITPETKVDNNSVFKRLGYTWGKPVVTSISWQGKPKLVVILTGGYDTYYDSTDDIRRSEITDTATEASTTTGNAIYIVDAKTGRPLIVASNTATNLDLTATNEDSAIVNSADATGSSRFNKDDDIIPVLNSHMKFSIPGSVKVMDRDADELTDHVYFADLNGQVFRMDINNAVSKAPSANDADDGVNPTVRVTRLADLSYTDTTSTNLSDKDKLVGPRFYEAPLVTLHDNDEGRTFAVVSMASGDRSNPLWEPESTQPYNHVYAIYDKDVAKVSLFNSDASDLVTKDILSSDLVLSPTGATNTSGVVDSSYDKNGWVSPLDTFTNYERQTDGSITYTDVNTNALKALGVLSAVGSHLYVPTFNPDDGLGNDKGCTAEVEGSTEAVQYCLPYGYCAGHEGETVQANRIKIGNGILGIVFGSSGDNDTGRVLLKAPGVRDEDGDLIIPEDEENLNTQAKPFKDSYRFDPFLKPMIWFDLQSQRLGTTDTSNAESTESQNGSSGSTNASGDATSNGG